MIVAYDTEVAKEVGADAATLFQSIQSYVFYNESNEKNFHDGEYWTYDTTKAIAKRFPHMSEKQIRTCLDKLTSKDFIVKGNFNNVPFDRTMWYSLTEKGKKYAALTRSEYGQIDLTKWANGSDQMGNSEMPKKANEICPNGQTNTNILPSNIPSNKPSNNKRPYGEFGNVMLTDEENEKLKVRLGPRYDWFIKELDLYIGSSKNAEKYKSHYMVAIRADNDGWFTRNNSSAPKPLEDKHAKFKSDLNFGGHI